MKPPVTSFLLAALAGAPAAAQQGPGIALEPILSFTTGGGTAQAIAFSPDGTKIASGGENADLILWDRVRRSRLWSAPASDHWIGAVTFSPDGGRLAAMGGDLTVWDVASGKKLFARVAGGPHGLAWSRDGRRIAYHSGNGVVNVLDGTTYELVTSFNHNDRYPINSVAFTDGGRTVLAGDNDGKVWSFDVASRAEHILRVHSKGGSTDHAVQLVGVVGGKVLSAAWSGEMLLGKQRLRHPQTIYECAIAANGARFAAGGTKGLITVWDGRGRKLWSIDTVHSAVAALAFSDGGEMLASTTYDGRILIWSGARILGELPGHSSTVQSVAFSADSSCVAGAGKQTVFVDLGRRRQTVLKRGGVLAPGKAGTEVRLLERRFSGAEPFEILDGRNGKVLRRGELEAPDFGRRLDTAISPGGKLEAVAAVAGNHGEMGWVKVTDAAGHELFERRFDCAVHTVAFSPSGRLLVFAKGGGSPFQQVPYTLQVIDTRIWERLRKVSAEIRWWRFLDERLALALDGGRLALWDTREARKLHALGPASVRHAALSPDRTRLALASGSRVHVYRLVRGGGGR